MSHFYTAAHSSSNLSLDLHFWKFLCYVKLPWGNLLLLSLTSLSFTIGLAAMTLSIDEGLTSFLLYKGEQGRGTSGLPTFLWRITFFYREGNVPNRKGACISGCLEGRYRSTRNCKKKKKKKEKPRGWNLMSSSEEEIFFSHFGRCFFFLFAHKCTEVFFRWSCFLLINQKTNPNI